MSILWTAEQVEELKIHWSSGKSGGAIAKIMNISRNAVIGKANRLGLTARKAPNNFPILKVKNEGYAHNGRCMKDGKKKHHLTIKKEIRLDYTTAVNETIFGVGKKLQDVGRNECRWPVGEDSEMLFCCAPVNKGSYCDSHKSIAFKPKPEKRT